jgi:hypothetical protein
MDPCFPWRTTSVGWPAAGAVRLRVRSHERIRWQTEVPIPIAGDLRAADAMALIGECSIVFELYTRLVDVQAQTRAAHLKKRDLTATRLVLVVAATSANRRAIREAGPTLTDSFPMGTRAVLRALSRGDDPGGDGIVLL